MKDSIYGMTPVNKSAALVTSQSGCTTELTDEQRRDNLVQKVKSLVLQASKLPKNSLERKLIGKQIGEINLEINIIRPKKKCIGVENHFIDVARENLSKFEFDRWMGIAASRVKGEQS